jgi:small subunit ribosomal protein S16
MLKIKLKRLGSKNYPFYHIVLMNNLSKITSKNLFNFGYYNPHNKEIKINLFKIHHYIKKGAYPTKTVRYLIYNILK